MLGVNVAFGIDVLFGVTACCEMMVVVVEDWTDGALVVFVELPVPMLEDVVAEEDCWDLISGFFFTSRTGFCSFDVLFGTLSDRQSESFRLMLNAFPNVEEVADPVRAGADCGICSWLPV